MQGWQDYGSLPAPYNGTGDNWHHVYSLAFSKDGRFLAAGSDSQVHFWHVPDFTDYFVSGGSHTGQVRSVAFSPDGNILASGSLDGTVKLWDTSTCQLIRTLTPGSAEPNFVVFAVAFSPDGQTLAIGASGNTPDGTGAEGNNIFLFHVSDGTQIASWLGHNHGTSSLAFSPDGQSLASCGGDNLLKLWLVSDGSLLTLYDQETFFDNYWDYLGKVLEYTPDGKYLLYGRTDGTVCAALNPYRNAIFPPKGGNTGNVTVRIVTPDTFPVADGTTVTLHDGVNPDITVNATVVHNPNQPADHVLTMTFNLNGAPLGLRDVIINSPGSGTQTYPQGFTIEQGEEPNIVINMLGPSTIRGGVEQTFQILVANFGNVDGGDVPVWFAAPKEIEVTPDFDIASPPILPEIGAIDYTGIPFSFDPLSDYYYPFLLPFAPSGYTTAINYTVKLPNDPAFAHHVFSLLSWISAPALQNFSALLAQGNPAAWDCLTEVAKYAAEKIIGHSLTSGQYEEAKELILQLHWQAVQFGYQGWTNNLTQKKVLISSIHMFIPIVAILVKAAGVSVPYVTIGKAVADVLIDAFSGALPIADCASAFMGTQSAQVNTQDITAGDPNSLSGLQGFGPQQWTSSKVPLDYAVYFSNEPNASAAADVVITDHLDAANLDMTTLQLGAISFAGQQVTPAIETSLPVGLKQFNADVDLRPNKSLIVHINASVDMLTGDLTWTFTSIDPKTGLPPTDPTAGFLDPGQEGSVLFTVQPKTTVPTGTVVQNQATIVFDVNPPMNTPVWTNTLDNDAPASHVLSLPSVEHSTSFTVQWMLDSELGSGLRDYTIYASDNGGPFMPWLVNTTDTQATFTGQLFHTYAFYSTARDNVFNVEAMHPQPDAVTSVGLALPIPPIGIRPVRPIGPPAGHGPPHHR